MDTLFLVNPRADRVAKQGSLLQFVADCEDVPLRLLDDGFVPVPARRVYIEGGDGTVQSVVSRYLQSGIALPQFAIVKGGTTNQVAGIIGLKRLTTKGLRASLNDHLEILSARMLEVTFADDVRHGFLFSSGAIPQVTDRIADYRGKHGRAGFKLVGRAVIDATRPGSAVLESSQATVMADTQDEQLVLDGHHLGTIVTTLPSLYAGLDPFWGDGEGDLRVTYADGDARALLPTMLGLWAGRRDLRKLRERGFQSFNAHSLTVRTKGGMVLDGEVIAGDEVVIRTTRPVTFVR